MEYILDHKKRDTKLGNEGGKDGELSPLAVWNPPAGSLVKLNVDAAVPDDCRLCTTAFIVRNGGGEVLMSGAVPIGNCLSVFHAELVSILRLLELDNQAGFREIMVASNNLSAIDACNGAMQYYDYTGTVVHDILRIAKAFTKISFIF